MRVNVVDETTRSNNPTINTNNPANKVLNQQTAASSNSNTVDDNGFSRKVRDRSPNNMGSEIDKGKLSDTAKTIYRGANLFTSDEIRSDIYTKVFRYGIVNPYSALSSAREFLFFTKPDLHIFRCNDSYNDTYVSATSEINPSLRGIPFWEDLISNRKNLINMLQISKSGSGLPFNYLLQNQCKSNLDIPGLSSEMIDTPVNNYGVGYSYRGSSEASDDSPEFSLEFKDNRFLDTFYFFKAYEEYETMKHHGTISPARYYIVNKVLHDCFSIYKFIVADDMETIVYWGKMYGVIPKSLPRDSFSNPNFDEGLSYSVDFKAAFYEDMKPEILADFNSLGENLWNSKKYNISTFNSVLGRPDTRPAEVARVVLDSTSALARSSPTGYVYKLKWKGDSEY